MGYNSKPLLRRPAIEALAIVTLVEPVTLTPSCCILFNFVFRSLTGEEWLSVWVWLKHAVGNHFCSLMVYWYVSFQDL